MLSDCYLHLWWFRSIATDGVAWSVCVSVCLSVGHVCEPCRNGRTDRDADGQLDLDCPVESCIKWGSGSTKGKGQFLGMSGPLKSIVSDAAAVCAANKSITASARLLQPTAVLLTDRCRINFSREKCAPCDAAFRRNSLTTSYDYFVGMCRRCTWWWSCATAENCRTCCIVTDRLPRMRPKLSWNSLPALYHTFTDTVPFFLASLFIPWIL